ncbi:MAG: ATP-binding protein [Haloglomus sp.]
MAGEQWQREVVNERKDSERIVIDQTVSPLTDADGAVEKSVAVAHDVTERRTHERRLKEQRDDLKLLNQVLRHDVRNDLQLVTAYADMLADHVDETGREYLATIQECAGSAVELTTTAWNLSAVILQSNVENAAGPLHLVVDQQVEEVRATYHDAGIQVEGSLPETDIVANSMLGSVFRNLLKNAVQHDDKPIPEVTVSATERDNRVTVRVANNGPGVPDELRASAFGKEEKGLDSDGTGIGLYLVQSLVESYGGSVHIEANDPEGAVFVVELRKYGAAGGAES